MERRQRKRGRTGKDGSLLTDLSVVSELELLQVSDESARFERVPIPLLIELAPKDDVILDRRRDEPSLLSGVGGRLGQDGGVDGVGADDRGGKEGGARKTVRFAEEGEEKRRLTRTDGTENDAELALGELDIDVLDAENARVLPRLVLVGPGEGAVDDTDLDVPCLGGGRRLLGEHRVLVRLLLVEVVVDTTEGDEGLQCVDEHVGEAFEGVAEDVEKGESGEGRLGGELGFHDYGREEEGQLTKRGGDQERRTLRMNDEDDDGNDDWRGEHDRPSNAGSQSTTPERAELLLTNDVHLFEKLVLPAASPIVVSELRRRVDGGEGRDTREELDHLDLTDHFRREGHSLVGSGEKLELVLVVHLSDPAVDGSKDEEGGDL